tara:strand:+ start:574 stop:861 length:288 start_codon:yes stop_codon:yes gene_type:complete
MDNIILNCQTGVLTTASYSEEEQAAVQNYIDNEQAADQIAVLRTKRNNLLAETDYLALSDVTLSDEMRTYRQALRDLPANTSDPANPTWPTKPGG